jgi:class 3 adenylate cyclase
VAELVLDGGHQPGESQELEVTVLMSDIRGYTTIAEHADPATLAGQLNTHRARMNDAILSCGGTVMQYVGDAVMAVFGAPLPQQDHAENALRAALAMHVAQAEVNAQWAAADAGLLPFGIGIGLSTGTVAAALLGSSERLEYTVVGDAVNLSQRLQQLATPGETVLSAATMAALPERPAAAFALDAQLVKGRETPVEAWKLPAVTL